MGVVKAKRRKSDTGAHYNLIQSEPQNKNSAAKAILLQLPISFFF